MLEFLIVSVLLVLLVVGAVATIAWRMVSRLLRSPLVTTGTQLVADGALAAAGCRLRPTPNRAATWAALRVSRAHRLLRQQVLEAQRSGTHLGDVPAVLPRLEAEGRRLRAALAHVARSPVAAGPDLMAQADRHLATLADLSEAVGAAVLLPSVDSTLAREAEEAALGLRLYTSAYTELTASRGTHA
jgi:hypothetical protein